MKPKVLSTLTAQARGIGTVTHRLTTDGNTVTLPEWFVVEKLGLKFERCTGAKRHLRVIWNGEDVTEVQS